MSGMLRNDLSNSSLRCKSNSFSDCNRFRPSMTADSSFSQKLRYDRVRRLVAARTPDHRIRFEFVVLSDSNEGIAVVDESHVQIDRSSCRKRVEEYRGAVELGALHSPAEESTSCSGREIIWIDDENVEVCKVCSASMLKPRSGTYGSAAPGREPDADPSPRKMSRPIRYSFPPTTAPALRPPPLSFQSWADPSLRIQRVSLQSSLQRQLCPNLSNSAKVDERSVRPPREDPPG